MYLPRHQTPYCCDPERDFWIKPIQPQRCGQTRRIVQRPEKTSWKARDLSQKSIANGSNLTRYSRHIQKSNVGKSVIRSRVKRVITDQNAQARLFVCVVGIYSSRHAEYPDQYRLQYVPASRSWGGSVPQHGRSGSNTFAQLRLKSEIHHSRPSMLAR